MLRLLPCRASAALSVALSLGVASSAVAQIGGQQTFSFLNLPPGARAAGLGGVNVSARDSDPTMMLSNPALLNAEMDGRLALTFVDYLADIKQSTAAYAFKPKQEDAKNRLGFSLTYLNYGEFDQYDAAQNLLGKFSVNEYAAGPTYTYVQGPFTLGGTVKLAVSGISGNHSVGVLADVGALFKHPEQDFTVGLAVKNAGYQLKPYAGAGREPMPLDVQLGATIKPEHMPLRFSITAHHLQQLDIVYLDPNQRGQLDENGVPIVKKKTLGDKIARHFAVGGELLLGQNLNVRLGYNHLQRRELRLDNTAGGAGISFGVMLRISQFQLDYTRAGIHASGSANYFTVARNLNTLFVKKQ
ncbi:type IX secretion system protein PorQ [Microvirga sp. STR05]|uniref:Type IX secretion system protein PorQ n=1 Tax=Hymenobacter duratus TaxID=2771356 RepID=A0ABR8JIY4_9BACT|nr:type IX secretion system protein PorQ [Hymenobacter duratus]MBD2714764.1 type IX secretion system protein PorQ [Hymenobacter duratus]MBR7949669.1 type IX secretion system protein PorQ [Microvirga sp. STR05]